jgi:hypothetical protein
LVLVVLVVLTTQIIVERVEVTACLGHLLQRAVAVEELPLLLLLVVVQVAVRAPHLLERVQRVKASMVVRL